MHQGERGTGDLFTHTVSLANGLRERRLPGPEIAVQCDDERRIDLPTEPSSPFHELGFGQRRGAVGRERRQQVVARRAHLATLSSKSWSRSVAASSKSMLAAASFICSSSIRASASRSIAAYPRAGSATLAFSFSTRASATRVMNRT